MIEFGHGTPLVVIPGMPGPWRFVAPAVHALSRHFRVFTLSLGPECTIDSDVARIMSTLDQRGIDRAVICGVSLGGLIAVRFAARYPQRTAALVLVSSPGPGATLRPRHRFYARWPWLGGPLLMLETPVLLWRELRWSQLKMMLGRPVSFAKMAKRALLIDSTDIAADCTRLAAPTLVVTGEPPLDRIVSVESTLGYLRAIRGATHVQMDDTGHLGSITHASEFAHIVSDFAGRPFQGRRGAWPERPGLQEPGAA